MNPVSDERLEELAADNEGIMVFRRAQRGREYYQDEADTAALLRELQRRRAGDLGLELGNGNAPMTDREPENTVAAMSQQERDNLLREQIVYFNSAKGWIACFGAAFVLVRDALNECQTLRARHAAALELCREKTGWDEMGCMRLDPEDIRAVLEPDEKEVPDDH